MAWTIILEDENKEQLYVVSEELDINSFDNRTF